MGAREKIAGRVRGRSGLGRRASRARLTNSSEKTGALTVVHVAEAIGEIVDVLYLHGFGFLGGGGFRGRPALAGRDPYRMRESDFPPGYSLQKEDRDPLAKTGTKRSFHKLFPSFRRQEIGGFVK